MTEKRFALCMAAMLAGYVYLCVSLIDARQAARKSSGEISSLKVTRQNDRIGLGGSGNTNTGFNGGGGGGCGCVVVTAIGLGGSDLGGR